MTKRLVPIIAALSFVLAIVWSAPASADSLPTGEHITGNAAVEPAYNDVTGSIVYLLTPIKTPLPTHANSHAIAPLYLVEYPPGSNMGTLNCMGVPGNCPDHDGLVASVAVGAEPTVYGNDPSLVPGHDHLVATPASGGDFNVAWEVIEVVWTPLAVTDNAITHLTTEAGIDQAVMNGYARTIDLGFNFHCSVVSSAVYNHGAPVG